jgi:hypothetical protein
LYLTISPVTGPLPDYGRRFAVELTDNGGELLPLGTEDAFKRNRLTCFVHFIILLSSRFILDARLHHLDAATISLVYGSLLAVLSLKVIGAVAQLGERYVRNV